MAGDWIKFETSTSDKPEVWAMAQSLGIDADAVVGKLLRVWAWFDQQTQEGNAVGNGASVTSSVTKALLDRRVGVSGFCDSMILSGWMADDGQSLTLPNFDRHNGKTAKTRAMTAKRVATHKAKSNADSVTLSVSGALPREEKRREEDITHTHPLDDPNGLIGKDVIVPDGIREWFIKWLDWRWQDSGKKPPATLQETWVYELITRGEEKAINDLRFSITKQAKNLLHSENDFDKVAKAKIEGATKPAGRETAAEAMRRIFRGET
jgi:hypothetical protein